METKKYPELGDIDVNDFRKIWNEYIKPLASSREILHNTQGGIYIIEDVTNESVIFSPDSKEYITVEFTKCQMAYQALLQRDGYISRTAILSVIGEWRSSFIVSLLATLPHVEETSKPRGLRLK